MLPYSWIERLPAVIILACTATVVTAQDATFEIPVTNPRAKVQQRVAATDIEVVYNRPSMKGRKIFGELIPYDQVWRTGSDASTKITFSTEITIENKPVPPGTYELFTIPGSREWTIMLQQNKNQWGSYTYKPELDVIRVTVAPQPLTSAVESFTIAFANVTSRTTDLVLSWEKVTVAIPLSVDLKSTVLPRLEEAVTREGKRTYFRAAMFYYENDLDINRAVELMTLAVQDNPNHLGMLYRLALILEKKGDKPSAIAASEKSLAEAQKAGKELSAEYVKLNTELLARLKR